MRVLPSRAQAYGCGEKQLNRLQRVCGIRDDATPLDRQYLFNVYSHPSSSYKGALQNLKGFIQLRCQKSWYCTNRHHG